jgi:hypothetical protein
MTDPTAKPRWFRLTPDRCVVALLALEGFLFLSDRCHLMSKGWPAVIAAASVGVFLLLMFLWFLVAFAFRLRFQFSLLSLLGLVLAVALPCSWLRQAMIQRDAVARITAMGGTVQYDYDYNYEKAHELDDERPLDRLEPPGSPGLRALLGDDLFNGFAAYSVASVDLQRFAVRMDQKGPFVQADVSDEDLRMLHDLPMLRCLSLEFQPITDAGIEHLSELKSLEEVNLYATRVSDDGVRILRGLPNLEKLNVGRTRTNAVALTCLLGKTKLNTLELSQDQIDKAGGWEKVKALFPGVQIAHVEYTKGAGVSMEIQ